MRTTALTTTGLLGLALLAPTAWAGPASAAGETCRGEAATIVGTGPTVTGTEGRDVIVSGSATSVSGLGGDDLICVAIIGDTRSNVIDVDAGTGDDVVDTTAMGGGYYVTTTLGAGADTFVGGRTGDTVLAGEAPWDQEGADTALDRIDTGTGRDEVFSGSPGTTNRDVVRLGDGDDHLTLGSPAVGPDAVLDAGAGDDSLRLTVGSGDIALDMARGTFTTVRGTAQFTSFEFSTLTVGNGTLTYRGTEGRDSLTVHPEGGAPTLDVVTGGGDDYLVIEPATIAPGSRIDSGAGTDTFTAATSTGRLALDLPGQRLTVGDVDAVATGLEDAFLMAPEVVMTGDGADNELMWTGCDATLRGGAGDDSLRWQYDSFFETYEFDCVGEVSMNGGDGRDSLRGAGSDDRLVGGRGHDTIEGRGGDDRIRGGRGNDKMDGGEGRDDIRGGKGHDRLLGRLGHDTLIGGGGRDFADGSRGRDRCVAERERRCER
jgi:Ca2+-binding RTX toxin-like protein